MHQWLLLATTKSLTGTNATVSLHTAPLITERLFMWCRLQAFFDCCFPLNLGQSRFMWPASPLAMESTLRSHSTKLHRSIPTISIVLLPPLLMLRPLRYMSKRTLP